MALTQAQVIEGFRKVATASVADAVDRIVKRPGFLTHEIKPVFPAKIAGPAAPSGNPENTPTLTEGATEAGQILGTVAYMAPEQARGQSVDKRADIWAFGVVVYEMLSGRRLFDGETLSDVLAAVITKEPAWERVPHKAQRLVKSCLEKDPKGRLRDIADA